MATRRRVTEPDVPEETENDAPDVPADADTTDTTDAESGVVKDETETQLPEGQTSEDAAPLDPDDVESVETAPARVEVRRR